MKMTKQINVWCEEKIRLGYPTGWVTPAACANCKQKNNEVCKKNIEKAHQDG